MTVLTRATAMNYGNMSRATSRSKNVLRILAQSAVKATTSTTATRMPYWTQRTTRARLRLDIAMRRQLLEESDHDSGPPPPGEARGGPALGRGVWGDTP